MLPYFDAITKLLARAEATNAATIAQCADILARSLAAGGVLHAFGTGHSHVLAEELFHRAGGLVPVNSLLDARLMLHEGTMAATLTERLPGYAEAILSRYSLMAGEVMIVASNSGRNAVPIEMALGAKARGLYVIALTSVAHSSSQTSRHASGKRLFEVADAVLDNCGEVGDTALPLPGTSGGGAVCATSTVIGVALLQSLVYGTAERLVTMGVEVPFLRSSNVGGGEADAQNDVLLARYRSRITHL
jgi:uncharacterized phosphosugar-binding protein